MSAAGKRVFITGGASGLGLELVLLYAAEGATIGIASLENPPDSLPDGVSYWQADVCDPASIRAAIQAFSEQAGGLDILIANAGINHPKAAIPDFDRGRRVIEVNVMGVLNSFEPAIEIMKAQGQGQLAALSSIAGTMGTPGTAIYGASKAAVANLCEAFDIDLARHGIKVTTVAPGFVATPLTANNQHKMPMQMDALTAAKGIKRAIDKRKGFVILPFRMMLVSRFFYHLPRSWYRWFMRHDPMGMHK